MPDDVHLIFTPGDSENHKMYSLAESGWNQGDVDLVDRSRIGS